MRSRKMNHWVWGAVMGTWRDLGRTKRASRAIPRPNVRPSRRAYAALLTALVLAVPRHALAYRTSGEPYELTLEQSPRWSAGVLTFDVWSQVPTSLNAIQAHEAIAKAFQAWTSQDCASLTLDARALTSSPPAHGDGRNTVGWISDWPWEQSGPHSIGTTDITFGQRSDGSWEILEADILLNANVSWSLSPSGPNVADVFGVVAHEVGHFIGLAHPCELDGSSGAPACGPEHDSSLLHPAYRKLASVPNEDDRAGACALYPFDATACTTGSTGTPKCAEFCTSHVCSVPEVNAIGAAGASGCAEQDCSGSKGKSCLSLDDCPLGTTCVLSECLPESAQVGDQCRSNGECTSLVCDDGVCREPCDSKLESCTMTGAGFGQRCKEAQECASRLCLETTPGEDTCTRLCSADPDDCPAGSVCRSVDGQLVCAPTETTSGDRCSCAIRHSSNSILLPLAAAVWGLFVRRTALRAKRKQRALAKVWQF